jgi:hypothetical protein
MDQNEINNMLREQHEQTLLLREIRDSLKLITQDMTPANMTSWGFATAGDHLQPPDGKE